MNTVSPLYNAEAFIQILIKYTLLEIRLYL